MEFKLQEWFNDGALEEKMSSYLGFDWNDPFAKAGVEMSLAILESSGTVILLSAMRRQYKEEDFQPKLSPAELLSVKKTLSGIRSRQQESIIKILRENVVKYLCYALNESRSKCQVPPNPSVMLGKDPDVQTIVNNFETLSESDQKWIRTILMHSKEIKTNLYVKLYSPPPDPADVDERRAYIENDNYRNLHVTTESDIRRFYHQVGARNPSDRNYTILNNAVQSYSKHHNRTRLHKDLQGVQAPISTGTVAREICQNGSLFIGHDGCLHAKNGKVVKFSDIFDVLLMSFLSFDSNPLPSTNTEFTATLKAKSDYNIKEEVSDLFFVVIKEAKTTFSLTSTTSATPIATLLGDYMKTVAVKDANGNEIVDEVSNNSIRIGTEQGKLIASPQMYKRIFSFR